MITQRFAQRFGHAASSQIRRSIRPAQFKHPSAALGIRYVSQWQKEFTLNTGAKVPALGFGTFQDPDAQEEAVARALQLGFRHIDTAQVYDTEVPLGNAMEKSGVPRDEIFLSTKLWMTNMHPDDIEKSVDSSLANMRTPYLDVILLHFPFSFARGDAVFPVEEATGLMAMGDTHYLDSWKALEKLAKTGKVKAIGISNFTKEQVQDLIDNSETVPAIHQIELHPWLQQPEFIKWHQEKGIHNTAYSPLGNSNAYYTGQVWSRPEATSLPPPTEHPILIEIAKKYDKSPHQVAYAWGINSGRSVLSKSVIDWQIVSNLEADFKLDQEDMQKIATMDKKARFNDPSPLFRYQCYEGLDGFLKYDKDVPVETIYGRIGNADTR